MCPEDQAGTPRRRQGTLPNTLSHDSRHTLFLMYIPRPPVFPTPSTASSAAHTTPLSHQGHQPTAPVTAPAPHQKPPSHDARHVELPSNHPHIELGHPPSPSGLVIPPLEAAGGLHPPATGKRDTLQSQNATVGAVVGVLMTVFLGGIFWFVHRYHRSIRLRRRDSRGSSSRSGSGRRGRGSRSNVGGGSDVAARTESETGSSSAESAAAAANYCGS